ncbi:MAG: queuosine precursor transporter [Bacteroidia bacterium]|nr:queuosine precursor transporter [Bacteroidia bacterium]NNF32323.1 queuosine precursor transporter [Flavobacteriaceae bacterium]MBT8276123.1 queuosine precursor transporter [Bacteroidia bacterium]NNJ81990.1 queuosine precursor transporter [Flavobacteriaceae bacterium]NNK53949.1 queuosine precursor transporter [Flavobacteriaceae bacterium]
MTHLTLKDRLLAQRIYLILGALFIASLVVSNLIFQKFISFDLFGIYTFEISVGVLPYPITFLITDIICEVYGQKKANQVVTAGIFASFFSMGIIYVSSAIPATTWSPVSDALFETVFGATAIAVLASMMAYLLAQYIDISIFHFWKRLTKGKHLWLRNNFSTFLSQFVDTFTVLILLCTFGKIEWKLFGGLLLSGFLFKVIVAATDTPFLYAAVYGMRKRFGLKFGEELDLNNVNVLK